MGNCTRVISSRKYRETKTIWPAACGSAAALRSLLACRQSDYQPSPPYFVLNTPTLTLEQVVRLMEDAQDAPGIDFDALPPPALTLPPDAPDLGPTAAQQQGAASAGVAGWSEAALVPRTMAMLAAMSGVTRAQGVRGRRSRLTPATARLRARVPAQNISVISS